MKKIQLLLPLLLLLPLFGMAQNTSIGLRGGLTIFNFTGKDASDDSKSLAGINGGAFFTYSVNRNWGLTGEINYMAKGTKSSNDINTRVAYLEIPIYVSYFFEGDKLRPKLFAGGTYGSLMTAKVEDTDVKDSFESSELGAVFGAGFHYRFTGENWLIMYARYGLGLTDITKNGNQTINNGGFSINVGVSFPLGNY